MSFILHEYDFKYTINVPPGGVMEINDNETPLIEEQIKADKRIDKIIIPESVIARRVKRLASEIIRDYGNKNIDILVVLTGAIIFASDLGRAIYTIGEANVNYHLVKTSVYGGDIKKNGDEEDREVRILMPPGNISGRDIIIVEDIVDQGFTLTWLSGYLLSEKKINSLRICSLLDKSLENPSDNIMKQRDKLRIDYAGFRITDRWIAGYGIDTADTFRNLPFIITVNEEYYK